MSPAGSYIVCVSGHVDHTPDQVQKVCGKCGEALITNCPSCGDQIAVHTYGYGQNPWVDPFCGLCGKPFPWTENNRIALLEAIEELGDDLTVDEREKLKASAGDALLTTTKSEIAVVRYKKAMDGLRGPAKDILVNVLSNVASESFLQAIGLKAP